MSELLSVTSIGEDPATFVRRHGRVIEEFGPLTQDSGNVSWLVEAGDPPLMANPESQQTHFAMPTREDVERFKRNGHRFK